MAVTWRLMATTLYRAYEPLWFLLASDLTTVPSLFTSSRHTYMLVYFVPVPTVVLCTSSKYLFILEVRTKIFTSISAFQSGKTAVLSLGF